MAEKLTNSQEVALRRIMTNAPGTPSRSMVRTALATGMSEREIMKTLRAGAPKKKSTGTTSVAKATQPAIDALLAKARKKRDEAKNKPSRPRGADPLGLARPKPKAKTKGGAQSTVVNGRAQSTTAEKSTPKAKNFNVGVSKGGVPFKEAFAHFRKKGAKTFTWNGKKYTTELAKPKKKKMSDGGAALKKPTNPGLKKLPTAVRNRMGFMNKGGVAKKK